jgi:plasmid stabilization system protein ParE
MGGDRLDGYRLHPEAERDLEAIWRFTAERWSGEQADQYFADLLRTCELLVRYPEDRGGAKGASSAGAPAPSSQPRHRL